MVLDPDLILPKIRIVQGGEVQELELGSVWEESGQIHFFDVNEDMYDAFDFYIPTDESGKRVVDQGLLFIMMWCEHIYSFFDPNEAFYISEKEEIPTNVSFLHLDSKDAPRYSRVLVLKEGDRKFARVTHDGVDNLVLKEGEWVFARVTYHGLDGDATTLLDVPVRKFLPRHRLRIKAAFYNENLWRLTDLKERVLFKQLLCGPTITEDPIITEEPQYVP